MKLRLVKIHRKMLIEKGGFYDFPSCSQWHVYSDQYDSREDLLGEG